ncbi:MAG: glycosyltransferase [Fidelibacterota bacterium]
MKVLHLSQNDYLTGAARAAYRLHRGLGKLHVESVMIVDHKVTSDRHVIGPRGDRPPLRTRLRRKAAHTILRYQKSSNRVLHSLNCFPSGLHRVINAMSVDVIHLHWIHDEMISIREIALIRKPLVWTFHDTWAFCGAEHVLPLQNYSRPWDGYTRENRSVADRGVDLDRWVWRQKRRFWRQISVQVVTPSNWLKHQVTASRLFRDHPIHVIPNPIDTDVYCPGDRQTARRELSLPTEKTLLGVFHISEQDAIHKGRAILMDALSILVAQIPDWKLVVMGGGTTDQYSGLSPKILQFNHSDKSLVKFYRALDVFILPSMMDNLPNTAVESLACGTPVVAFRIGGIPDIIDNKKNGYLAQPGNPVDLVRGIRWTLDNRDRLSAGAQEKAIRVFRSTVVAKQFENLYQQVRNEYD